MRNGLVLYKRLQQLLIFYHTYWVFTHKRSIMSVIPHTNLRPFYEDKRKTNPLLLLCLVSIDKLADACILHVQLCRFIPFLIDYAAHRKQLRSYNSGAGRVAQELYLVPELLDDFKGA